MPILLGGLSSPILHLADLVPAPREYQYNLDPVSL